MLGVLLAMTYSLHHLYFSVGNLSSTNKHRLFAQIFSSVLICWQLKLEGIHVDEEKTINDPELLMEMMEIREAVNDASDSQTLEKIQSQVKKKLEIWSRSFEDAFHKKDFDRAIEATQRMRYYERAVEETVKKL